MTQRITNAMLESLVKRINEALGVPQEPYLHDSDGNVVRDGDGRLIANAGTVYLAGAYGGVRLEQMCKGGGCRDLLSSGYDTKRNVWNQGQAFLNGSAQGLKWQGRNQE